MIGSKPGSFSTHAGVVGKDLGEPTETTSCRDAPLMGIDWRASMETVVGCLSDAEAECASGVSLFDKDQMLGAAEKKLKDRTVSGEEGDVCWSRSLLESNFVVLLLLFVIDMLMRAGPGQQGWDSTILNKEE